MNLDGKKDDNFRIETRLAISTNAPPTIRLNTHRVAIIASAAAETMWSCTYICGQDGRVLFFSVVWFPSILLVLYFGIWLKSKTTFLALSPSKKKHTHKNPWEYDRNYGPLKNRKPKFKLFRMLKTWKWLYPITYKYTTTLAYCMCAILSDINNSSFPVRLLASLPSRQTQREQVCKLVSLSKEFSYGTELSSSNARDAPYYSS